ncbi:MAG TPA: methylated-DNA--[protein]-cysteine S-methyltransferase [Ferruginibacter sp.]|nr:methylated-DNA--[protein]-cysteine S-methyltransferase [Ferruginibacter sp.]
MINETVYYRSPIGVLEIRSSDNVITHILFANSWKGSAIDEANISFEITTSPIIKMCINELSDYFKGERTVFTFPITFTGTPFQETVWKELQNIPYGRTISYLELSKRIGNTKAIRAVGTANGNNAISIVVPCHRVIGSNGDLIGYGGDLWRKKWLLDHENKFANGLQTLF